ncbi:MAG TPA: pyridoxamine 5'-phosphate oxidase family protein [Gemmatimonadaceae bacterium]|jgi:nitroimidazol reductase NimA-like FMN-containing flavoprotein (pyridoxamine 5'-phosphate oxidase superfamily)|nr:pyridoxamine 5'-phosphate oxidase family protein [Gemmatimonadaceae bacterium]
MTSATGLAPALNAERLSRKQCMAMLERNCFAHLAFVRRTHADVVPIRIALAEGWLYFRADRELSEAIGHNAWVAITVSERLNSTRFTSVVARGTCYATEHTGSPSGDAAALRGIVKLRDRAPAAAQTRRSERTLVILRVRVEELRGTRSVVPCDVPGPVNG